MPDPNSTAGSTPNPPRNINFGQLIELCFHDPGLFLRLCAAVDADIRGGLDAALTAKGVSLDPVESPLVSARLQTMSRDERKLYTWMFSNTTPNASIIPMGGYSLAGSPSPWP